MDGRGGRSGSALNPAILAKLSPWCRAGTGLCDTPAGTVALIGDSHADQFAGAVAESLKQAGLRGTLYKTVNACALMQDSYAIDALDERPTNKCRIGQREWRNRIEAENPALVILSSFWLYGVSSRFPARYVDDQSTEMPELSQSRARFERKIAETVEWLTANRRKVIIIGSTVWSTDRPRIVTVGRKFSVRWTVKSSTSIRSRGPGLSVGFFPQAGRGPDNVLYVDVESALCNGSQCTLAENGLRSTSIAII